MKNVKKQESKKTKKIVASKIKKSGCVTIKTVKVKKTKGIKESESTNISVDSPVVSSIPIQEKTGNLVVTEKVTNARPVEEAVVNADGSLDMEKVGSISTPILENVVKVVVAKKKVQITKKVKNNSSNEPKIKISPSKTIRTPTKSETEKSSKPNILETPLVPDNNVPSKPTETPKRPSELQMKATDILKKIVTPKKQSVTPKKKLVKKIVVAKEGTKIKKAKSLKESVAIKQKVSKPKKAKNTVGDNEKVKKNMLKNGQEKGKKCNIPNEGAKTHKKVRIPSKIKAQANTGLQNSVESTSADDSIKIVEIVLPSDQSSESTVNIKKKVPKKTQNKGTKKFDIKTSTPKEATKSPKKSKTPTKLKNKESQSKVNEAECTDNSIKILEMCTPVDSPSETPKKPEKVKKLENKKTAKETPKAKKMKAKKAVEEDKENLKVTGVSKAKAESKKSKKILSGKIGKASKVKKNGVDKIKKIVKKTVTTDDKKKALAEKNKPKLKPVLDKTGGNTSSQSSSPER